MAIVGGGIVGMATAMALTEEPGVKVIVLEAESRLAAHQTGNNSGVIHSGLYYKPGSLKALNCVEGRQALYRFCERHGVPHERCGKLVVATRQEEIPRLDELFRRGTANGLQGLRRLEAHELVDFEPHAMGLAGLHVPDTGIVNFVAVTEAFAECVRNKGGEVRCDARVLAFTIDGAELIVTTGQGEVRCRHLINCAGLYSDRIARACGIRPGITIVPFRGEYYELVPSRQDLVRALIYPVPDPRFPFLGVHFTRMIHGGVEAGPNAVLAFKREGYHRRDVSLRDMGSLLLFPGFWVMGLRHWRMGFGEFYRSCSKTAFVRALQRLVPALNAQDIRPGGAGVRAQALDRTGALLDDFSIIEAPRMIHVLNAPSPAATASISIGCTIAGLTRRRLNG